MGCWGSKSSSEIVADPPREQPMRSLSPNPLNDLGHPFPAPANTPHAADRPRAMSNTSDTFKLNVDDMVEEAVCCKCKGLIAGHVFEALGKTWHVECFRCKECGQSCASGVYDAFQGQPYHTYCGPVRTVDGDVGGVKQCTICRRPVEKEAISAKGQLYHDKCFKCQWCTAFIKDDHFVSHNAANYHTQCAIDLGLDSEGQAFQCFVVHFAKGAVWESTKDYSSPHQINEDLAKVGMYRHPVPGDGNCFFAAVSMFIDGCSPTDLRKMIVGELRTNSTKYVGFHEGGHVQYMKQTDKLEQSGNWDVAGNLADCIVLATVNAIGKDIQVYTTHMGVQMVLPDPGIVSKVKTRMAIRLAYNTCHYDAVFPLSERASSPRLT